LPAAERVHLCATVVRGNISMLIALTPAAAKRSTTCLSLNGSKADVDASF
jgi:hypothetical protein